MKRKIILLLLVGLPFGLNGCGMPGPLYETPESAPTTDEQDSSVKDD
ncbi:LPS translocon maturation chaperone LptM [Thalassotalea atypica]|nr:hypothetical protein [Thalassotalea atypica]